MNYAKSANAGKLEGVVIDGLEHEGAGPRDLSHCSASVALTSHAAHAITNLFY